MTDYILDGQPINSISTSYSEGSRRFLFWRGFWYVWSCSDFPKVFCMVGLFTSPPTNWRLFRVKFQQVNWPWNSKSCVICAPLGWVLVGTIGRRVSQVLITISVDMSIDILVDTHPICRPVYRPTCRQKCWLIHQSVYQSALEQYKLKGVSIVGGISVDYWRCIGWLSFTTNSLLSPPGGLFISSPSNWGGGLFEGGGYLI